MKILDWVHRKFRHNSNETPKDFSIGYNGQAYLDELPGYPKGGYGNKPLTRGQKDMYRRNSFTSLEGARVEEEEEVEEEGVTALTELFHGFLAIGTLGSTDPGTPTFSISVDHIAEKETQVTEDELKLINDELEKVLAAEGDNCNASSGRNSHVSVGRMSHCSAITLSGKPAIESTGEACNSEGTICPLQSYLFGSAVGLQETTPPPPVKKEHRTSLGELFQKTKQVDDNYGTKSDKRNEKESDKSAVHVMKKMLKRRKTNSGGGLDATTAETKLTKILQIFNRKVHPESPISCFQSHNPTKNEMKNSNAHLMTSDSGSLRPSTEDIIIYPQQGISKESICSYKNQTQLPQITKSNGDELWVKTDADYLVLEL